MTINRTSTIVGVFGDRTQADQAMDALNSAGFDRSQIRFAGPGTRGSFLEDIKSLFVGQSSSGSDITNNLTDMGLSDEEAQYYSNEYNNGNTVVAVQAPGREQEARNVLQSYNAYTYNAAGAANYAQQPSYAEQNRYAAAHQGTIVPGSQAQAQYQESRQQPYAAARANEQVTQPDAVATPGSQQPYSTTNTGRAPAEPQSAAARNERDTEFQNLQAQIQAVQQQLQDARAQLQSAKEREAQIRSTKEEHERQLRDSKQQLQNLQSELQNTLAELRDTQSRIGQYR